MQVNVGVHPLGVSRPIDPIPQRTRGSLDTSRHEETKVEYLFTYLNNYPKSKFSESAYLAGLSAN